jgi:2-polyprenyl-6-methoxyphenol hydroxylase-like FAD-dependent oxidoreductase
MPRQLRVAIVGGGTGGLCLAQALHKAGVEVAVYERTRVRTERLRGYRIHINPQGAEALHDCLPAEQWQTFVETCGRTRGDFRFVNEQLRELLVVEHEHHPDARHTHHSASRVTLHEVLSAGLTEILHLGKEFDRYEQAEDGVITCHFTDGTTATADVLVGADGAGSRVARQYLPAAQRVDTGIRAIAGKLPLTTETRQWLPAHLTSGPTNVLPPSGCGMFTAPHLTTGTSYLMWSYAANNNRYPHDDAELSTLDEGALRDLAAHQITTWHPTLQRMVTTTPPDTVTLLHIRTSTPVRSWRPTTITLLGDAIHSMTPFRGIGANTALRDAQLLAHNLIEASQRRRPLLAAIADYEKQMREYGFAAVRLSLRTARQTISNNHLGRRMFKAALKVFRAVPPLKRKAFADLADG